MPECLSQAEKPHRIIVHVESRVANNLAVCGARIEGSYLVGRNYEGIMSGPTLCRAVDRQHLVQFVHCAKCAKEARHV